MEDKKENFLELLWFGIVWTFKAWFYILVIITCLTILGKI